MEFLIGPIQILFFQADEVPLGGGGGGGGEEEEPNNPPSEE